MTKLSDADRANLDKYLAGLREKLLNPSSSGYIDTTPTKEQIYLLARVGEVLGAMTERIVLLEALARDVLDAHTRTVAELEYALKVLEYELVKRESVLKDANSAVNAAAEGVKG